MNLNKKYDVVIVGAGLAGLACGLRLNKKGYNILIIEKNNKPGGKISELHGNGFRWDQGPSLLTEPENIIELFQLYNKQIQDYIEIIKHDESCRYFFPDKTTLSLSSDLEKSKNAIRQITSDNDAKAFEKYILKSESDYKTIGTLFLNNSIPSTFNYLFPKFIKYYPYLISRKLFQSLHTYNRSQFESKKMNLIFNRFGTYNGSNPYQMSGLYSMIPSLELMNGTFFPKLGMRSIVDGLYNLAKDQNIDFAYNTTVTAEKTLSGFNYKLNNQTSEECEFLVCAMDHITFYQKVMKDSKLLTKYKKQELSSSGLIFYWGIDKIIDQLGLHNIIFSENYKKEFDSIFKEKKNCIDPTVYIHVSSILSQNDAPINGQNLFVMINTSAYDQVDEEFRQKIKLVVIKKIEQQFNVNILNNIVFEDYWDNASIESITGSYLGSLYGASSNKVFSAYNRHPNTSKKYKKLYFCGGTVHPGGGIPLVLRSAKIVSDSIE